MLPLGLALPPNPFAGASWLTVPAPKAWTQKARWIWVQRAGDPKPTTAGAPEGTVRLVQNWTLREPPRSATVWFTADNSSRVWINGHVIGNSSAWERLQRVDVRDALKKGANRIEVEATNGHGAGATNPAGFLFAGEATLASGNVATLLSDKGWQSPDGNVTEIGGYDSAPWHLSREDVPCPAFRREFELHGKVKRAVARVIGLGQYDLFVNGHRQGNGLLNGPWSQYDKTLYWQEFDLTKCLQRGPNVLGVELGNSFYRVAVPPPGRYSKGDVTSDFSHDAPYLLAMAVDVEYADGHRERIVTDRDWRWGTSNYTLSHVYAGEDYDARRRDPAWMRPGDAGDDWQVPRQVPAPKVELREMDWPAFKAVQSWKPTEILHPKPGSWSYVFPQNAMAIVRFRVKGPRGATVKFRPSEVMTAGGEVQQLNLGGADASGSYTLRGGASESHEWRFFFHGFRYVEVTGAVPQGKPNPNGLPVLESLEMVHVRTDNPQVGAFHSSDRLFDQTHDLVDWAVRSNMAYVLSDCPTREKMGWLECAHLLFPTIAYRYDAQAWFHKIARDIRDIQLPDGRITTVAPDYLRLPLDSPYQFTVEWGAAGVLVPWQGYQWYGDRRFLTESYASMKRYVDWIDHHATDGLAPAGLGDWYDYGHGQPPGPSRYTPTNLTSTAMWAICANAVIGAADALGEKADAERYRAMHQRIKTAFLAHFYDPATETFQNSGSVQSGHAMALYADLVPAKDRPAVLNAIVAELERRDYQQTPGDVGHRYFILALAEGGRSDILHKVYNRTGVGSYGGILAKGLTTMPESWDALTVGGNSLNHPMLGHIQEWFYGWVLGIRQAPGSVGWKSILIAPEPGETTSAKGKTGTPQGPVSVEWKREGNVFQIEATIPKGTRARIVVPFAAGSLELDGQSFAATQGPFGRASIDVGPGSHTVRALDRRSVA
ncbi:glycoside hydrolase family 78 protein [soil metagenome]